MINFGGCEVECKDSKIGEHVPSVQCGDCPGSLSCRLTLYKLCNWWPCGFDLFAVRLCPKIRINILLIYCIHIYLYQARAD